MIMSNLKNQSVTHRLKIQISVKTSMIKKYNLQLNNLSSNKPRIIPNKQR